MINNFILNKIIPNAKNSRKEIVVKGSLLFTALSVLYGGFVFGIYFSIKAILKSIDKLKATLIPIALSILYTGIVFGVYSIINALLKSIDKLKEKRNQKRIEFDNKIEQTRAEIPKVSAAIEKEAAGVNAIQRYKELNSIMNDILSKVASDQALNNYVGRKEYLSQRSYYDYCGYFLNGRFNWPFAEEIYRTEQHSRIIQVEDHYISGYDPDDGPIKIYFMRDEVEYYEQKVYDHTKYFEVNGSVNTEMAEKFRSLYSEKTNFETNVNALKERKKDLEKQKKDLQEQKEYLSPGTSGRINVIFFIGIATEIVTGLFIYTIYSLISKSHSYLNDISNNTKNIETQIKDFTLGIKEKITAIIFIGIAATIITGLFIWAACALGCKSYDLCKKIENTDNFSSTKHALLTLSTDGEAKKI